MRFSRLVFLLFALPALGGLCAAQAPSVLTDSTTGVKYWQLYAPDVNGSLVSPGILNRPLWNANGSLLMLNENYIKAGTTYTTTAKVLYGAGGTFLRKLAPVDPTRTPSWKQWLLSISDAGYWPFDKVNPNRYYLVSWNDTITGSPQSNLYAVDATTDIGHVIVALPNPTRRKTLYGGVSEQNVLMVRDVNPALDATGQPTYIPMIYMVDLKSNSIVYQYPINFGLQAPCHSAASEYHIHDIQWLRDGAQRFVFNYGPQGDVGEACFFSVGVDGTGGALLYPNAATNTPYLSHPAYRFDGNQVVYGGSQYYNLTSYGYSWVGGLTNPFTSIVRAAMPSYGHGGWDGYDPGVHNHDGWIDASACQWGLFHMDPRSGQESTLIFYPPRCPNNTISLIFGPTQSPDATKTVVFFPTNWTAATYPWTANVVIDHAPNPPTLSASAGTLSWTPYVTTREIQSYQILRAPYGSSNYTAVATVPASSASGGTFVDTAALCGTYSYVVQAVEYSGLQSAFSNTVSVVYANCSCAPTP